MCSLLIRGTGKSRSKKSMNRKAVRLVAVAVACGVQPAEGGFQCRHSLLPASVTGVGARDGCIVHRHAAGVLDSVHTQNFQAEAESVHNSDAGESSGNPVFGLLRIRRRAGGSAEGTRPRRKRRVSPRRNPTKMHATSSNTDSDTEAQHQQPSTSRSGSLSRVLENSITARLERWSTHALNLRVLAKARPLTLLREGAIGSDFKIQFDSIAFHNIRISGGGVMYINDITLDWLRFFPLPKRWASAAAVKSRPRFIRPFEFHARNFIFEKDDIVNSSCIRNGLQNLFNRILNRNLGFHSSKVMVESVDVMPDEKKLFCRCQAITPLGTQVPFEIRTGLGVTGDGHILTFPRMELSLHPETTGVFVPILPEIHLDVGHNAKIESIVFTGKGEDRRIRINAKVTVTPTPNMGKRRATKKKNASSSSSSSRSRRNQKRNWQEKASPSNTRMPSLDTNMAKQAKQAKLATPFQFHAKESVGDDTLREKSMEKQEKGSKQRRNRTRKRNQTANKMVATAIPSVEQASPPVIKHYQYERPVQPQVAPSPQLQNSFLAHFACDVGMWVTNLGNFTK